MIDIDCNAWKDKWEAHDKSKTSSIVFVHEAKDGDLHSIQQSGGITCGFIHNPDGTTIAYDGEAYPNGMFDLVFKNV